MTKVLSLMDIISSLNPHQIGTKEYHEFIMTGLKNLESSQEVNDEIAVKLFKMRAALKKTLSPFEGETLDTMKTSPHYQMGRLSGTLEALETVIKMLGLE